MTENLHYSKKSIQLDFLRAGAGLACTLLPLALVGPLVWVGWICAALAFIFALYGVRTYYRARTVARLEQDGLYWRDWREKQILWEKLNKLKLRYYSTQRNRENGWFQLQLETDSERIKLDTNLEEFDRILATAFRAAQGHKLSLDTATRENLIALNLMERA
ncbi:hypothetical protein [Aestuariispira insulae]|uniref:Uncharacterized protein n=1 Tax=Aestuariispira insulae TaxID=1461337 RepID=A0A3D9HPA3_9PROT|nr:hypothetical protein [Aestuariispira insulae]RED51334.1 hypothetical protein DFP90_103134 [Aestuariispira insulae]